MKQKKQIPFFLLILIALVFQPAWISSAPLRQDGDITGPIIVGEEVTPLSSVALSTLPLADDTGMQKTTHPSIIPLQNEADQGKRGTWDRLNVPIDPLIQSGVTQDMSAQATLAPLLTFDGIGNPAACSTCTPPNVNGDVGPNYYVQMVEQTKVAVYSKAGGPPLKGPIDFGALWPPADNCVGNSGSPIVLYDPMADRWVFAQNGNNNYVCFAVSKTADPTGEFWLYGWDLGVFSDYLKIGVWPDGYYMSANGIVFAQYAFDRANMLLGQAANYQKAVPPLINSNFYMPSDFDGATPPPVGTPNYFYTFKDGTYHGSGNDRLEVYAFHVDWATPTNSTFSASPQNSFDIAPFTYTVCGYFQADCIGQLGTSQKLNAKSEFPMFRFPYRNFGDSQSLVGAFTVGGGLGEAGAAIRWFELRNPGTGWTLYQEGTFDPGDGNDRFMPSIAMDKIGNIALGYSVSRSTMNPSIRYTVHRVGDAPGTMQPEATMFAGSGSQTGAATDWGSYSSMSVDPSDDATFWYTNEYYAADSATNAWQTRIGKLFKITMFSSTVKSIGIHDGWVLESTEKSNKGGTLNTSATTFNLGDDAAKKQYRSVLSFKTSGLDDKAYVTKVTLRVKKAGVVGGGNPVSKFKGFMADIKKGFFGTKPVLTLSDFNAANTVVGKAYGPFTTAVSGGWYNITLASPNSYVNKLGLTQIRLRFKLDDNNNKIANILKLYSGNAGATSRPQLIIEYYIP